MSKQKAIFFIGLWVAVLPFLGFPGSWKRVFFVATGVGLAYLGYILNKQAKEATSAQPTVKAKMYTETKPEAQVEADDTL